MKVAFGDNAANHDVVSVDIGRHAVSQHLTEEVGGVEGGAREKRVEDRIVGEDSEGEAVAVREVEDGEGFIDKVEVG